MSIPNAENARVHDSLLFRVTFVRPRKRVPLVNRTHRELTEEEVARIYRPQRDELDAGEYGDVPGFCKSAILEGIRRHSHVLDPGRYVGAEAPEDDGSRLRRRYGGSSQLCSSSRPRPRSSTPRLPTTRRSLDMAGDTYRTTVGDYVTLVRGTTYKGRLVGKPGPALLGLGSIEPGGGFRVGNYKTYGGECPDELMLFPGDIYASLKGATKDGKMIGSVARVPPSVPTGRLTQDTVKLVFRDPDPEDVAYLYWVLRTPQYRAYCDGHATGSAVVALSRRDFLSYSVPPLTPQRRTVVAILDRIEEKIELNERLSKTLEAMARALFKSWFVDFDPVHAKAEGRDPGLPNPLADLFPDRLEGTELGEIPEGWSVESLAGHFKVVKGVSYKGSGLGETGTPLHNLNSIYEGGGYKYEGIKYYMGRHSERHVVRPGDVIVANTEQGHERLLIGYAAIVPAVFGDYGIASHHVYRLRRKQGSPLTSEYASHLLNSPKMHDIVSGYANGTTVSMLPFDGLQMPEFVCPPQTLIAAFHSLASTARQRREEIVSESRILSALREVLLPKLVSGEFRIPVAEKRLEAVL